MLVAQVRSASVVGGLRYTKSPVGFALPVLGSSEQTDFLLQRVDEITNTVIGFQVTGVFATSSPEFVPVAPGHSVRVGESQILIFRKHQHTHVGDVRSTKAYLSNLEFHSLDPTLELQIAEFIDDEQRKRTAIQELIAQIKTTAGNEAARNFIVSSVVRFSLWKRLSKSARDHEAARRIIALRPLISVSAPAGRLQADLTAIDPAYLLKSKDALIAELKEELAYYEASLRSDPAVERLKIQALADRVTERYWHIMSLPRQEARIARIMRMRIEEPEICEGFFKKYSSAASYERQVLADVRALGKATTKEVELRFAQQMRTNIKRAFGYNRGIALYHLANELGGYKNIRRAIEHELILSRGLGVRLYEQEIHSALRKAAKD